MPSKLNRVTRLSIDRTKWLRGGHNGRGYHRAGSLLNGEGCMCCLGFLSLATGVPEEKILSRGLPRSIILVESDQFCKLDIPHMRAGGESTAFTHDAAEANDTKNLPIEKREAELKKIFKKEGIRLTFRGKRFEA